MSFILWFTGLSGAGKSTLANAVAAELKSRGVKSVEILDGDEVREHISKGLGFSREDRRTNILRIGYVARTLSRHGTIAITAAISPYAEDRKAVRAASKMPFVEVFAEAPIEKLAERDVKGLYKKALAGEIKNFTGVSDPYEAPDSPEVRVKTAAESVDDSKQRIIDYLVEHGLINDAVRGVIHAHGGKLVDRMVGPDRGHALVDEAKGLRKLTLSRRELSDLQLIAEGALSPLEGFQGPQEIDSIVEHGRLPNGLAWTIPITLVDKGLGAKEGERIALVDESGQLRGVVSVERAFKLDRARVAQKVFGTTEDKHPGVVALMSEAEDRISGPIDVLPIPREDPRMMSPRQVRQEIMKRGWREVAAFQTRNPLHRSHEYLVRTGIEVSDGVLLHPLVGETKKDDVPADVRMKCYEALLENYLPKQRVLLSMLDATMRYAGPAEAIHHAIMRQNFGCSRLIVGRDHAGVGKYYGPFDAQERFSRYEPEALGIRPLKLDITFWCNRCGGTASEKTCGHAKEDRVELSGTEVRRRLNAGEPLPQEFSRPEVAEILRAYYRSIGG
jgi:sulfate adenylyltransferase/3'-phosphoadenosine 5'-phosphosulfate synthase